MSFPARTLAAPRPPEPPAPSRFPLIATIAPLAVSVALFAVTKSPFTLVFAALGPVVAVASTIDGAIHRRRARRRETARFEAEVARAADEIDAAHAQERDATSGPPRIRDIRADAPGVLRRWGGSVADAIEVCVGTAHLPSTLRYDQAAGTRDPHAEPALAELRDRAALLRDAPVVAVLANGIGVVGPRVLAASAARAIALQLAATLSPRDWVIVAASDGEDWAGRIPHRVDGAGSPDEFRFESRERQVRVLLRPTTGDLPRDLDDVLELRADGSALVARGVIRPDFLGLEEARSIAESLARIALHAGVVPRAEAMIPATVRLRALGHPADADAGPGASLSAIVGMSVDGPVTLDLANHGPHAIVGGTTGSGKSELLLTWVLGMAASRSPDEVTFLFVDFKGGASFGSLVDLPHSVGMITDLDTEQAVRALASLSAELRYRERTLAAQNLRSVDAAETSPFPRMVVVVDEYAALVETFPTLHSVFADIAARGRSLGVHLILCTQRPAGVVRDGILANCTLRVSLRVSSAADSVAVLGTDAAASLPARPSGRALVSTGGGAPTPFQVALSDDEDAERVLGRWQQSPPPRSPWLPPLPAQIPIEALGALAGALAGAPAAERSDGILFALADLPAEQAQRPVAYRPREHGSLVVVGAARSGKTGVLTALSAAGAGIEVIRVPSDLPGLWDFLGMALAEALGDEPLRERVAAIDDLDSILAACPEAYQSALVDRLARLLRDGPASGWSCVLTAQRLSGSLSGLASLCGSALMLRMPNRSEHALAGGEAGEFVADLPPGAGHWRGMRIQVAAAVAAPPPARALRSVVVDVRDARVAVVSSRPEQFAAHVRGLAPARRFVTLAPAGSGHSPEDLEVSRGGTRPVLIADPEQWQSQWTLFTRIQRGSILFDGCSIADLRALTRSRDLPPPFPASTRTLWLLDPEAGLDRATLVGTPLDGA